MPARIVDSQGGTARPQRSAGDAAGGGERAPATGERARGAGRVGRALAAAGLLGAAAVTLGATWGLATLGAGLRWTWGGAYPLVLGLAVLSSALALRAALLVVPPGRGSGSLLRPAHARAALVAGVLALGVHLIWLQPFRVQVALATLALAGGLHGALALWIAARRGPPRPLGRALELLCFSLAVTVLGLELGLRQLATHFPHPLLAGGAGDARSFLAAYRLTPGEQRFRFPVNSRGDFDHEWSGRRPGQKLIVCIGDSFSTGPVPLPLHFTSVAERMLTNTEVYNMGAPAIGPPEYLLLLEENALPMQPDLVIVNLFVGNDMRFRGAKPLDVPALRAWLDADEVVLARLSRRMRALSVERERQGGAPLGVAQGAQDTDAAGDFILTPEQVYEAFPFTVDPSLERPMFSPEEFLRLETGRALVCDVNGQPYHVLEAILDRMLLIADRVPLAIFLIPDEFQIDDELWEKSVAAHPKTQLDRFLPQKRVRAWCDANGIDLIDTTGALLAAPPLEDGLQHLYHLRDTHWNARGNEVAGRVLGEYLRERFER